MAISSETCCASQCLLPTHQFQYNGGTYQNPSVRYTVEILLSSNTLNSVQLTGAKTLFVIREGESALETLERLW